MNQQLWTILGLGIYFSVFAVAVVGIGFWAVKRRREKPPLEFKFLRGPGETLRQRLNQFDEDFPFYLVAAGLVPLAAVIGATGILLWLTPHMRLTIALAIVGTIAGAMLFFGGRWVIRGLLRRRDDCLGYLGERAVGEALVPLIATGYRVFHDVPAEAGKARFNIDHVVVGRNGIFAIETKTRRKGRVRPGFKAHEVAYDGKRLAWPWAEDSFALEYAEVRARWIGEYLNKLTGLGLSVQPVLALPGWYVVPKGIGSVIVANHKQLARAITRGSAGQLSDEQIDLIARQLDSRCRDVED